MQAQAKLGVEVGQPVLSELTKWNSSMFGWARRIDLWEFVAMLQVRGPATNKIATPVSIEALCTCGTCALYFELPSKLPSMAAQGLRVFSKVYSCRLLWHLFAQPKLQVALCFKGNCSIGGHQEGKGSGLVPGCCCSGI